MLKQWLLVALVAFAAPAAAQIKATLKMKDGSQVTGIALAYDTDTQTLTFKPDGGPEQQINISELDGRTVYQLNRSNAAIDDAPKQLAVGNFARDVGLFAHAARHYDRADAADPTMNAEVEVQRQRLRRVAAVWALETAKAAQANGDWREAERWLKRLIDRLPNEPEADEARKIIEANYTTERQSRDDEIEAKYADVLNNQLASAKRTFDRMVASTSAGLTARNTSSATRNWNSALRDGERVLRDLDSFEKRENNSQASEIAASYRPIVIEHMVDVHLNIASSLSTRTDFQGAQRQVNKALALDPGNTKALETRRRIEVASSRGIGWGL